MPTLQISDFRYIDSHVHFFPERMFRAIWAYFEKIYRVFYPSWINRYQLSTEQLVEFLKNQKIKHYTTLNYAHKRGIAEGLNEWTHNFCQNNPAAIPVGTAHPDDPNFLEYSEKCLTELGFKGFKFQFMVTDFYIHDSRLKPLYRLFHDLDKILIMHTGTAPGPNQQPIPGLKVGFKHFLKFFKDFPDNKIIVPHLGGYEYESFFKIVEQHPNVFLDITMVFVDPAVQVFPEGDSPINFIGKSRLLSFLEDFGDQILYGSDFPNIPYDYSDSIKGFLKLGLSKKTYEKIFFTNAKTLFDL